MENLNLLILLSLTTLVLVVLIGVFLRLRVAAAKRRGEHSALMDDPRMTREPEHGDTHRVLEGTSNRS